MLPIRHTGYVNTAVFSPDGKRIITASDDNTAKIWDVETGALLIDIKGHTEPVWSTEFSPDGKKIITSSDDKTVKIWSAQTGTLLANLMGKSEFLSAHFSPDGKKIITTSSDNTAKIWNAQTGILVIGIKGNKDSVWSAKFSPDGRRIVISSENKTVEIWDSQLRRLLNHFTVSNGELNPANFSPDGERLVTSSSDGAALKIWDVQTGTLLTSFKGENIGLSSANFSPDGKKIVTADDNGSAKIWNIGTGAVILTINTGNDIVNDAEFSSDGKKIVTASMDKTTKVWNAQTGALLADLRGHTNEINSANFSPDGKKIVTLSKDENVKIYDSETGVFLTNLKIDSNVIKSANFSPDGGKIVVATWDNTAKIFEAQSGALLMSLQGHTFFVTSANFSPDGKKIVTASEDRTAKIWDVQTGDLLINLKGHTRAINSANFSPDGKKIVTASSDCTAIIWDAQTGALLGNLNGHTAKVNSANFSPDSKKIVTASWDHTAKIWDARTGTLLANLGEHTYSVNSANFSPDGKRIVTASSDNTTKIWDVQTGALLGNLNSHTAKVNSANFSPDGKRIVTASDDNTAKMWNAATNKLLYTFLGIDSIDYLVVDKYNHYDGTERAKKLLYFTCGTEIISFDQVKDKLWVPNLAQRINNGDSINAPKLSDLKICGLAPSVEIADEINNQYRFRIIPGSGGLGETVLYINGNETKRYLPGQLHRTTDGYELSINRNELKDNFITGRENPVMVKAYTSSNDVSSRGTTISILPETKSTLPPSLYAVMVGVSDYKGGDLDLKYAAKDANDLSHAIENAAKKWLDKTHDGNEHVFMYNLTTEKDHYLLPEKNSIKQVIEDIGKKATANDILLIFFAGHGVMWGDEKKQFYFLTADASTATATSSAIKDVGISASELIDWIQPAKVKAQKRILILDACNSGQAINDIVKIGYKKQNFVAVRNEDNAAQIKSIDKLNERSGLFILAASATNQSAYEMSLYSQGLLTYALLKTIKQDPSILQNNKYLNVGLWFDHAENIVNDLVKETGARQQPQIISTTNFNIGIVDEDVIKGINLANEKPIFASCNFQNADANIEDDDVELGKTINQQLNDISLRGVESKLTYFTSTNSSDAWLLIGKYEVKGETLTVRVNLKQGKEIKYSYEITGTKNMLNELADKIVNRATGWILKNKQ